MPVIPAFGASRPPKVPASFAGTAGAASVAGKRCDKKRDGGS